MSTPALNSQGACIVLGISSLVVAAWAFDQAWEKRGEKRPVIARLLAI